MQSRLLRLTAITRLTALTAALAAAGALVACGQGSGSGEPAPGKDLAAAPTVATTVAATSAPVSASVAAVIAPSGVRADAPSPTGQVAARSAAIATDVAPSTTAAASASALASATPSASASVAASAAPSTDVALTVEAPKVQESNFGVWMQTAKSYKVGQAASVEVVVVPKGNFHCNEQYPYKVKMGAAPAGVSFAQDVVRGASISAQRASIRVPFTASAAGDAKISGKFYFSVCNADQCVIDSREVAATVKVE